MENYITERLCQQRDSGEQQARGELEDGRTGVGGDAGPLVDRGLVAEGADETGHARPVAFAVGDRRDASGGRHREDEAGTAGDALGGACLRCAVADGGAAGSAPVDRELSGGASRADCGRRVCRAISNRREAVGR